MPRIQKAFTFGVVNDSVDQQTTLELRAIVAPAYYKKDHPFAFRSAKKNEERFADFISMQSAQHNLAGKFYLEYPLDAKVFAGAPVRLNREPSGKDDYKLVAAEPEGQKIIESFDSLRNEGQINAAKDRYSFKKEFDWKGKQPVDVVQGLRHMLFQVTLDDKDYRASAFDVVHKNQDGDRIGSLTFLFLPTSRE